MKTVIYLKDSAHNNFIGSRYSGRPLREKLETILMAESDDEVVLDFQGVFVTQSFIDEFIGALVLKPGPDILRQLVFKNCSVDVKSILNFVTSSRIKDYRKAYQLAIVA